MRSVTFQRETKCIYVYIGSFSPEYDEAVTRRLSKGQICKQQPGTQKLVPQISVQIFLQQNVISNVILCVI
jgi:hypothetical protein